MQTLTRVLFLTSTLLTGALTGTMSGVAQAQSPKPLPPVGPLLTTTVGPLDVSRLTENTPVVLQVQQQWEGPNCLLREGSTVQGHVGEVVRRTKLAPLSSFEVVLTSADCNGRKSVPFALRVFAASSPTAAGGQSGTTEAPPLADLPLSIGGNGTSTNAMRSVNAASDLNNYSARPVLSGLPATVKPGQVIGMNGVLLRVGEGPQGGSILSAMKRDVRLERGAVVILAMKPEPVREGTPELMRAAQRGGTTTVAAAAPVELPDTTEICGKECSSIAGSAGEPTPGAGSMRALSIRKLGYKPHDKRLMTEFGSETTLTYLDENTLLCTFDPHFLREHDLGEEDGARTIRAVLVDTHTLAIERVVEWRVRGNDAYLWRAGDGHVLVHIGRELQLLDRKLTPERRMEVHGRVAFVAVSPAGSRLAVGTIREQHSEEVHRQMVEQLGREPEEPVEIRVVDAEFHEIARTERTTKSPVPVLAEDGELRVVHGAGSRWSVSEYRWDRTQHSLATVSSSCRPKLSVPARDITFVVGCTASGAHWYKMLRADGKPVLKADSPSDEVMQSSDEATADRFAVRLVRTARPLSEGQQFSREDLTREEVAVYRRKDGRGVSVIRTENFALGRETYALSPNGDSVALAGTRDIVFYALPADAAR